MLIAKWRKARDLKSYNLGYEWAASQLLQKTHTVATVYAYAHNSLDAFDQGVRQACRDYCNLVGKDNREESDHD